MTQMLRGQSTYVSRRRGATGKVGKGAAFSRHIRSNKVPQASPCGEQVFPLPRAVMHVRTGHSMPLQEKSLQACTDEA